MTAAIIAALRAHAAGLHPEEAGTELLIRHGGILHRDDFARFVHTGTSISDGTTLMAWIDWDAALSALHNGQIPSAAGNGASSPSPPASPPAPPHACATPFPAWTTGTWNSWSPPSATPPDTHHYAADHHQRRPGRETSRACSTSMATPQSLLPDSQGPHRATGTGT